MQRQPALVDFTRQRLQGSLALPHDAELAQRVAAGGCNRSRRRKHSVEPVDRRHDRLAERFNQPRTDRACRGHCDLLAEHRAHRQLKAVDRARHSQAVAIRKAGAQCCIDGDWVGIEIQHRAHTVDDDWQYRSQRIADRQQQLLAPRGEAQLQPARMTSRALLDPDRARKACIAAAARHRLDSSQRVAIEEADHGVRVVRRPIAELHFDRLTFAGAGIAAGSAQRARVQAVVCDEGSVEPAHAGEAAGQRHLGHGQARVGDELLGCKEPARLQILQRRHAKLRFEYPAQVPVTDAEPGGDLRCARAAVLVAVGPGVRFVDEPRRLEREDARGVFGRPAHRARCQFGPAAQTGSKAFGFGLRGVPKEPAVLSARRADAADRPAIDSGRSHRRKKRTVEARVVCLHGEIARIVVQRRAVGCWRWGVEVRHGAILRRWRRTTSHFRTSGNKAMCLQSAHEN